MKAVTVIGVIGGLAVGGLLALICWGLTWLVAP